MNAPLKPVAVLPADPAWNVMGGTQKAVFVLKLAVMVCSFGFIFGNVLTP